MSTPDSRPLRLLTVCLFGVAFAWVEAAVVFYLRTMVDRIEPYQAHPLPLLEGLVWVEIVREAATLVLLATVGILAGQTRVSRFGYSLVAFGVWDIFYYLFLKPMTGWPHSLLDWDVLFLIPLPWWGPILAPMLIALLMIVWGTLVTQKPQLEAVALSDWRVLGISGLGVLLALYVFMADALRVAPEGEAALRDLLPSAFHWPLFVIAWLLMFAPIGQLIWVLHRGPPPDPDLRLPADPESTASSCGNCASRRPVAGRARGAPAPGSRCRCSHGPGATGAGAARFRGRCGSGRRPGTTGPARLARPRTDHSRSEDFHPGPGDRRVRRGGRRR